jgi:hypothetical protein
MVYQFKHKRVVYEIYSPIYRTYYYCYESIYILYVTRYLYTIYNKVYVLHMMMLRETEGRDLSVFIANFWIFTYILTTKLIGDRNGRGSHNGRRLSAREVTHVSGVRVT